MAPEMAEVTVDGDGRIIIPHGLLVQLGLDAGTRLELCVRAGELVLRPVRDDVEIVQKGSASVVRLASPERLSGLARQVRDDRLKDVGSLKR